MICCGTLLSALCFISLSSLYAGQHERRNQCEISPPWAFLLRNPSPPQPCDQLSKNRPPSPSLWLAQALSAGPKTHPYTYTHSLSFTSSTELQYSWAFLKGTAERRGHEKSTLPPESCVTFSLQQPGGPAQITIATLQRHIGSSKTCSVSHPCTVGAWWES